MDLYEELLAVAEALDERGIDYALCGGLAVGLYGHTRATADIDLLVAESSVDAAKAAASTLGFSLDGGPMPFDVGKPTARVVHRVTKIGGDEPLPLDLIVVGPPLESVWKSRVRQRVGSHEIVVVSRAGLVEMKRLAGRAKDLADLEELIDEEA